MSNREQTPATRTGEVERLKAENERLKAELEQATQRGRVKQHVPQFLPEGTREELERTGEAVNPFDGSKLTRGDL
ncbi:hypothetical protein ACFWC6_32190 [Micromonospora chalcea]